MIPEPPRLTLAGARQRLSVRGLDGLFLSAGSELESVAELKLLVLLIVDSGHHDQCGEACFFCRAKKMHPESFLFAVGYLSPKQLFQILGVECAWRNQQNSPGANSSGQPWTPGESAATSERSSLT